VTTQTNQIEGVFARAWELLIKNWIIIVPGIIIGLVVGILTAILTPVLVFGGWFGFFLAIALLGIIGAIGGVLTQGMAAAMAMAAWKRGTTTLDDATGSISRLMPTIIAMIITAIVAVVLAPFTLGFSMLVFYLFTLYAFPTALGENVSGFDAIVASFRLTTARFVPTLIIAVLIFVIVLVAGICAAALGAIPYLGPIVKAVITQIVIAYAMLVIVGEYLNLRATTPEATAYAPGAYTPPTSGGYTPSPSGGYTPPPSGGYVPPPPPAGGYAPPPPPVEPYEPPPPGGPIP
jgi:hypothetical protein